MDKSTDKIKRMFDEIAERYDFNNNFISLGLHHLIKNLSVQELNITKNVFVLDLCTGTGDVARIIQKIEPSAKIIGVDFSDEMLKIAHKKSKNITFLNADCTNLPFDDNSFDFCTISFGLRNIEDKDKVLDEIFRVLKPNGKFLHLDFGDGNLIFNFGFDFVTKLLRIFYKKFQPYDYLLQSKKEFEKPRELIELFEAHGLKQVKVKNYLFNIISAQISEKII